ncbi:DUF4126 domain-containing protein [Sphingomonas suaedae]|uniref:DUF4126 domain-containing protein n=1 Tax=Sphingomonas suaedae TaxID=2599297 RepID=A0A518RFY6_9SPHN|nr:DUF4126 domain-containing protein [Sphingomonas suaedae]QDX26375.1 DUF4126 domain-containing protein [Sphingomonas suaedae]
MGAVELIGLAASVSLLAGWRLYLCVFAVGVAMQTGWVELPEQLRALDVLANPWLIGIAGIGAVAEFFADKVMWVDSLWDSVHTAIRPIGGALLALAIVDPSDPAWQIAALLLGGGGALLTHGAKAGTRAAVNVSPEPVSNVIVSTGEDIVTGGLLLLALASPIAAVAIAVLILLATIATLVLLRRVLRRLTRRKPGVSPG